MVRYKYSLLVNRSFLVTLREPARCTSYLQMLRHEKRVILLNLKSKPGRRTTIILVALDPRPVLSWLSRA